jgi:hypothetical protein
MLTSARSIARSATARYVGGLAEYQINWQQEVTEHEAEIDAGAVGLALIDAPCEFARRHGR